MTMLSGRRENNQTETPAQVKEPDSEPIQGPEDDLPF